MGYYLAGFDVTGVDNRPMPRYPFRFILDDALGYVAAHGREYDVIAASPPCQGYSRARHTPGSRGRVYPDLVPVTLPLLRDCGRPWVVENVPGAPLPPGLTLCGTMFGLPLRRHRVFASSFLLMAPGRDCRHRPGDLTVFGHCVQVTGSRGVAYVAGSGRTHYRPLRVPSDRGRDAMGCPWMNRDELSEAIPPVYCEWVGRQLLSVLQDTLSLDAGGQG